MVRGKRHAQPIRQLVVFHRHVESVVLGRRDRRRRAHQQTDAKRHCQHPTYPESRFHRPLLDFKNPARSRGEAPLARYSCINAGHPGIFQPRRQKSYSPRQYTARCCFAALVASEKRASAAMPSSSRPATYSPTAGPCLKPCPEPPPTSHTFSNCGCRSIRKSPLDVFSYWHTRVSTTGASRNAGKRRAT